MQAQLDKYRGLGISVLCIIAFGADSFMIPAMLGILGVLTVLRRPMERAVAGK